MSTSDAVSRHGVFLAYVLLFATLYAGFGVMSPFLPALLQARGLLPEDIGLALALSTVVRLVSGPVAGRVADRLGALRSVFAASATAAAICGLGFLPAHGFFQVVAVSVLYAAMLAPLTTIADALALSAAGPPAGRRRHFEYGWVRGAGSAAFIVGALVAGQAISGFGFDLIVWVSSALLAAAAGAAAFVSTVQSAAPVKSDAKVDASLRDLLRIREFRLLIVIAALVLGSHAMHDAFAVIRWEAAGISPPTASVLWSESVAAEIAVFVVAGPRVLDRFGPVFAMTVAALAGILRWSVMACTADVTAMALAEPLHGLSFALLHLACMRLIGRLVPANLAATAQAIYGTVAIGATTAMVTLLSGTLYGRFGASGFWVMATLCASALPFIAALSRTTSGEKLAHAA
jgi:MFS transporter, PPP family, 3-phenylpropionic acid transporter